MYGGGYKKKEPMKNSTRVVGCLHAQDNQEPVLILTKPQTQLIHLNRAKAKQVRFQFLMKRLTVSACVCLGVNSGVKRS